MHDSSYPPEAAGRPGRSDPPGRSDQPGMPGPPARPGPGGRPETARMPGALVFGLVIVTVHALATAFGGWVILQENFSKQEHGQDLILPWGAAWFMALFCWGLAALQIVCVALARRGRPWIRVALAASMIFVAASMGVGFFGSLVAGAPSVVSLVTFVVDVVVLRTLLGGTGRRWFSPLTSPRPPSAS